MNQNIDFIPFARPLIGKEEEEAVLRVMRSGWLTTGTEALAFEKEFSDFVHSPYALAVNSATSGLHLALESIDVTKGDYVICSPYTFTSSAAVIRHCGAEVAFCDIEPDTYNIDSKSIKKILETNNKCKAIMVVHVGGLPCNMEPILEIAKAHNCYVIEDAAHSFPSPTKNGYAGTLGDIGIYSFYATKTITTGEGGMLVTKKKDIASRVETMRMHGFDRTAWDRYTSSKASWMYQVVEAGFKYNLPDILAAIGREQLKKANKFCTERKAIANLYNQCFTNIEELITPPTGDGHSWHLYMLKINSNTAKISRDDMITSLLEKKIGTSVHFIPLHLMPYYKNRYNLQPEDFPNAFAMYQNTLSLPIWHGMGLEKAEYVAQMVKEIIQAK